MPECVRREIMKATVKKEAVPAPLWIKKILRSVFPFESDGMLMYNIIELIFVRAFDKRNVEV